MNTLEELTTKIDAIEKMANTNIDDIPIAVRGSWGTNITEAKDTLKRLMAQYNQAVMQSGVAIFLDGDAAKVTEFCQLMRAENEGFSVDASALYERLGSAVEETYAGREREGAEWGTAQTHRLQFALKEVMEEIGINELPMPSTDSLPFLTGHDEIVAHVRTLVRNACGDALNAAYVAKLTASEARLIRYIGGMVPVAIVNAPPEEVNGIGRAFSKGSSQLTLESTDTINKEFLIKTFKDINKKIRPRANKKNEEINEKE